MFITREEALTRYSIIKSIDLTQGVDGNIKSLPKELKVKIMMLRLAYKKISEETNKKIEDAKEGFTPKEYTEKLEQYKEIYPRLMELRDRVAKGTKAEALNIEEQKELNDIVEMESFLQKTEQKDINPALIKFSEKIYKEEVEIDKMEMITKDEYESILDINIKETVDFPNGSKVKMLDILEDLYIKFVG
ncbi:hypothetical protein PD691P4_00008 [Parabacteroides phage PD691P4]|jgi:hypothetical protein|nr:hypothetical protein PD691P4_00008 [Parabacteroides phage PD691P4]